MDFEAKPNEIILLKPGKEAAMEDHQTDQRREDPMDGLGNTKARRLGKGHLSEPHRGNDQPQFAPIGLAREKSLVESEVNADQVAGGG